MTPRSRATRAGNFSRLSLLWLVAILPFVPGGAVAGPVRTWFNVSVPMRDGVVLAAHVFLPAAEGRYPAILIRTPYGKSGSRDDAMFFAGHGYAVIVQDTRGRYDSDGDWYPFRHEEADGYDSIEWAGRQGWSNGKVATMGASYPGMVQWAAAAGGSKHLRAMVIRAGPSAPYEVVHPGGAFGTPVWPIATGRHTLMRGELSLVPWEKVFRHLPRVAAAALSGYDPPFYRDWVEHPNRDAYWNRMDWSPAARDFDIPVFHSGGWYDTFQKATIENFVRLATTSTESARAAQRLILGPWVHGDLGGPNPSRIDTFGTESEIDLRARELRWLDHFVGGRDNGADSDPRVEVFVMGRNEWRQLDGWPPTDMRAVRYYLHSKGQANSASGDGRLSNESPTEEPPDRYVYDPRNPAPTDGEAQCCSENIPAGPRDQRSVENRGDVLVYSTEPLDSNIEITGPIQLHLFASSSARDTDWTAKLVDVSPDGFARNLTDSILRARFRNSFERPELLVPGRVYEFVIDLGHTSNLFARGHRIRLEISSSDFPRYSPNTNTGNIPELDSEYRRAEQTVFHETERASCLILPVRQTDAGPDGN